MSKSLPYNFPRRFEKSLCEWWGFFTSTWAKTNQFLRTLWLVVRLLLSSMLYFYGGAIDSLFVASKDGNLFLFHQFDFLLFSNFYFWLFVILFIFLVQWMFFIRNFPLIFQIPFLVFYFIDYLEYFGVLVAILGSIIPSAKDCNDFF